MTDLHRLAQAYVEAREARMGCATFGLSKPVFAEACTREDRTYEALKTELAKPWREAVREEMWLRLAKQMKNTLQLAVSLLPENLPDQDADAIVLAVERANLLYKELTVTKEEDEG